MKLKTLLLTLLLVSTLSAPVVSLAHSSPSSSNDTALLQQLIALVKVLQQQLNELLAQQSSDTSSNGDARITVTYPNGGEILLNSNEKETIAHIQWTSSHLGNYPIEVDVVNSSGRIVRQFVNVQTSGIYAWQTDPDLADGRYKILVSTQSKEGAQDGAADKSDSYFTVTSEMSPHVGPLTIDYHNGGQEFVEGEEVGIAWHPNGPLTSTDIVKVELISTQGGKNYVLCQDSKEDCPDEDGVVYLEMPRTPGLEPRFKIKITGEDGQTDMSDKSFIVNAKG